MITDLANLGPPLAETRNSRFGKPESKSGQPEASSFDQILKKKSDKDVGEKTQANSNANSNLKTNSVPVEKKMSDRRPEQVDRKSVDSGRNEPRATQKEQQNWDEPGSVQEKRSGEKVGKKTNSSAQNREQVMLEFMDSMESEFGIPPQRMVEAMTDIPQSELLVSPEDSASQVIAQLELPEDQEQKALALYIGMLTQLKQAPETSMPKAPMIASASAGAGAMLALSSQQKREALNQSLDQMNSKFFMQGSPGASAPGSGLRGGEAELGSSLTDTSRLGQGMPQDRTSFGAMNRMGGETSILERPTALPKSELAPSSDSLQALQNEMQGLDPKSKEVQTLLKSLAALSASAAALDQGLQADAGAQAQTPSNGNPLRMGALPENGAAAGAGALSGLAALGLGGEGDEEADAWGDSQSSPEQNFFTAPPQAANETRAPGATAAGAATFGAMVAGGKSGATDGAENKANIQQLMNQAQYLIKKGGGEARIQMAPEGIGQVHMKMTVMEGKVNLEMQAESKEAKKLIENSIGDLKAHLGQHQLTVDQLKVDVGNQTSNETRNQDSQQRQQMDARQDNSKEQARQFWSEFNSNGGFDRRSGFNEASGIKAYGNRRREAPLSATSAPTVPQNRETGSGKGRGLNLVA